MKKNLTTIASLALILCIFTSTSFAATHFTVGEEDFFLKESYFYESATPVEPDSEHFPEIPMLGAPLNICEIFSWFEKDGDVEYTYSEYLVSGVVIKSYSFSYSNTNTDDNMNVYPGFKLPEMAVG